MKFSKLSDFNSVMWNSAALSWTSCGRIFSTRRTSHESIIMLNKKFDSVFQTKEFNRYNLLSIRVYLKILSSHFCLFSIATTFNFFPNFIAILSLLTTHLYTTHSILCILKCWYKIYYQLCDLRDMKVDKIVFQKFSKNVIILLNQHFSSKK